MSRGPGALAWAADVPLDEALRLWPQLSPSVGVVKVGLSLFVEHGPPRCAPSGQQGAAVFLDLKLHDIPNTVEAAAAAAGALGAAYLTVHASGREEMLRAAVRGPRAGRRGRVPPPRILAVTALTSLVDAEVAALGFGRSAAEMAARLAEVAVRAGVRRAGLLGAGSGGAVAPLARVFLCTPGIRPAGAAAGRSGPGGDAGRGDRRAARACWSSGGRCTMRRTRRRRRGDARRGGCGASLKRCRRRWLRPLAPGRSMPRV